MSTFFWADTHFGHDLREMRPQYGSVAEMDAALVGAWNSVVHSDDDEVWFLGDFIVGGHDRLWELFSALRGYKRLLIGNHDHSATLGLPWMSKDRGHVLVDRVIGQHVRPPLVLCHYPMESWPDQDEGAIHLHGHSHGHARKMTRRFDVGADVEPCPLSLDELVERVTRTMP